MQHFLRIEAYHGTKNIIQENIFPESISAKINTTIRNYAFTIDIHIH